MKNEWCYEHHLDTIDEVAAYLEVTPAYFWQAIDCYRRKLGSIFKYHGYLFDLRHGIDLVEYSRQKFIASNNEAH